MNKGASFFVASFFVGQKIEPPRTVLVTFQSCNETNTGLP